MVGSLDQESRHTREPRAASVSEGKPNFQSTAQFCGVLYSERRMWLNETRQG